MELPNIQYLNRFVKKVMLLEGKTGASISADLVLALTSREKTEPVFNHWDHYHLKVGGKHAGLIEILFQLHDLRDAYGHSGKITEIRYASTRSVDYIPCSIGKGPFRGIGMQAAARALEIAKEEGHEQRVVVEAAYGSGNLWERLGFVPVTKNRDDFLKAMKRDGHPDAYMYLPPENAQRIIMLSQNPEAAHRFYFGKQDIVQATS